MRAKENMNSCASNLCFERLERTGDEPGLFKFQRLWRPAPDQIRIMMLNNTLLPPLKSRPRFATPKRNITSVGDSTRLHKPGSSDLYLRKKQRACGVHSANHELAKQAGPRTASKKTREKRSLSCSTESSLNCPHLTGAEKLQRSYEKQNNSGRTQPQINVARIPTLARKKSTHLGRPVRRTRWKRLQSRLNRDPKKRNEKIRMIGTRLTLAREDLIPKDLHTNM